MKLDYIIANKTISSLGNDFPTSKCVELGSLQEDYSEIIIEDLMNINFKGHHDSDKLAEIITKIIN